MNFGETLATFKDELILSISPAEWLQCFQSFWTDSQHFANSSSAFSAQFHWLTLWKCTWCVHMCFSAWSVHSLRVMSGNFYSRFNVFVCEQRNKRHATW